jgi:hypothetical protein
MSNENDGKLLSLESSRDWQQKVSDDAERARGLLAGPLVEINRQVLKRARSLGADAVVLTGSTARGKRTSISDLDYLIIGAKPRVHDLQEDIDVHIASPERFLDRLARGDSFTHWTLEYGCVLCDSGIFREGLVQRSAEGFAVDPDRLLKQYVHARKFAIQVVASGDSDAAHREALTALSLGARWWLLVHGSSPLARSELPAQLSAAGNRPLADVLDKLIFDYPALPLMGEWLASRIDAGSRGN